MQTSTPREQGRVGALALAIQGRGKDALAAARAHIDVFPHDALVLSLALGAHGLTAFSGRPDHHAAHAT